MEESYLKVSVKLSSYDCLQSFDANRRSSLLSLEVSLYVLKTLHSNVLLIEFKCMVQFLFSHNIKTLFENSSFSSLG